MNSNCKNHYPIIREFIDGVDSYGAPFLNCELEGEICALTGSEEECEGCRMFEERQITIVDTDELPF